MKSAAKVICFLLEAKIGYLPLSLCLTIILYTSIQRINK